MAVALFILPRLFLLLWAIRLLLPTLRLGAVVFVRLAGALSLPGLLLLRGRHGSVVAGWKSVALFANVGSRVFPHLALAGIPTRRAGVRTRTVVRRLGNFPATRALLLAILLLSAGSRRPLLNLFGPAVA